ncbi:hypothetical protein BDW60DRAFT_184376 [Aspergillus nidulans var. acristatus]
MRTVSRCMPHMGAVSGPNCQVRASHCSLNKASGSPIQDQLRMACRQLLHLPQYHLLFYVAAFARCNLIVVRRLKPHLNHPVLFRDQGRLSDAELRPATRHLPPWAFPAGNFSKSRRSIPGIFRITSRAYGARNWVDAQRKDAVERFPFSPVLTR